MATRTNRPSASSGEGSFRIEGRIQREQAEGESRRLDLAAYVFDKAGALLGSAALDEKGNYSVPVRLAKPADVELLVGPANMPEQIRQSGAYRRSLSATEWKAEGANVHLKFDTVLAADVWSLWWPLRICVSGHVRKVGDVEGVPSACPVPYVKVEIFDVDRECCLWPHLRTWWELLVDRPVIRLPDLLTDPPFPPRPFPGPDPAPDLNLGFNVEAPRAFGRSLLERVGLNPQPLPPVEGADARAMVAEGVDLNPQPEPPSLGASQPAFTRVGEARLMSASIASRLDSLTLTSRVAPWQIFPLCFYSRREVCEATTDCNGYFNCCFSWWPMHLRWGRLRFDSRPDVIVRVTQVIDGTPRVIYMDPYTSTRWNVTNAHIDLYLDDEDVVCGPGCSPQPEGTDVFFTRVGDDYVYDIDQATGAYHGGGLANVAYGDRLNVQAAVGKALTEAADTYYYRLSIGPGTGPTAGPFKPMTSSLADTRVSKATLASESHALGPQVVNGQPALYEIRNTRDYYWYWPDRVGYWDTPTDVPDEDLYTVRLEVFDQNGNKLTSAVVNYLDGTVAPPAALPPMPDHCDLVLQIDNTSPDITLAVPKAGSACGVVRFTDVPFDIDTSVTQTNGRLHSWSLHYVKGLSTSETYMDSESSPYGLSPLPRNKITSSASFTAGLTTTCGFSLIVDAWSHVRNGYGWVYHQRLVKPVAVEKCG